MIKTWLFEFFRAPTEAGMFIPQPRVDVTPPEAAQHFATYWDLWTRAEGYGFEGIFFSEHHFGPGYSPSPHLLIAALAPVTRTLRMGVMGVVLPYHSAWQIVEEIGMLDHLTQGRLEVGTASGIPVEMLKAGISAAEAQERNAEAQAIIDQALTHPGEPITFLGKHWQLDQMVLAPRPLQQPAPPRWTTVVSEASARRAARRGTRICTGFSSTEQVRQLFRGYREEAEQAGQAAGAASLGLRRVVMVDRDGGKAREMAAKAEDQIRNVYLKADDRMQSGTLPDAPHKSQSGMSMSPDEFIAGTPAEVAEGILAQCEATGAGHFLAILDNQDGVEDYRAAFHLFGREVLPLLQR